jgi:hypothetical protein
MNKYLPRGGMLSYLDVLLELQHSLEYRLMLIPWYL